MQRRVFASQGQEAFIEGHLHAFAVLGGVPTGQIRYDNLRSAVSRVLMGRNRTESDRWVLFRSHYAFDAFYCIPAWNKRRSSFTVIAISPSGLSVLTVVAAARKAWATMTRVVQRCQAFQRRCWCWSSPRPVLVA